MVGIRPSGQQDISLFWLLGRSAKSNHEKSAAAQSTSGALEMTEFQKTFISSTTAIAISSRHFTTKSKHANKQTTTTPSIQVRTTYSSPSVYASSLCRYRIAVRSPVFFVRLDVPARRDGTFLLEWSRVVAGLVCRCSFLSSLSLVRVRIRVCIGLCSAGCTAYPFAACSNNIFFAFSRSPFLLSPYSRSNHVDRQDQHDRRERHSPR